MNKFFLLIALFCFITSCNIFKQNTSKKFIDNIKKDQKIDWFFGSGKIEFINNQTSLKLKANIKIRKDSLIWCSLSIPLGLEIYRVQVTQDSIYILDKINHQKTIKPIDNLGEFVGTDISFIDICNILIGKKNNKEQANVQFFYSEYSEYKGYILPQKIEIKSNISLTLLYNNIIINKPQKTPFSIPKSYVKTK